MFRLNKRPRYVEAAYNKVEWSFTFDDYRIGDMFYVDILKADGTLITTLVKNGSGTGMASFDVGPTLRTLFTETMQYNPNVFSQKDETAMKGYSIKAGYIKLVNRQQVKKHLYTSGIFYVLRAALPFDGSTTMADLTVDYVNPVQFLTDITPNQPKGNNLYLPVLFTAPNDIKVKINYVTEIQTINIFIPSPGVYVFNVKPELQAKGFTNFSVWLESDYMVYTSIQEVTDYCTAVGESGEHQATVFAWSGASQTDATNKAIDAAFALAKANLVCEVNGTGPGAYTSTKSVTVYCTNGVEGSSTAEATRTSNVSQADADQKAEAAARQMAEENLTCVAPPVVYTSTYQYTAYCPAGYSGERTVNSYAESTISQADADKKAYDKAKADAEGNLVCVLDEPPMKFAGHTSYGEMTFTTAAAHTTYPGSLYTDDGTYAVGKIAYTDAMGTYKMGVYYYKHQNGTVFNVLSNGTIGSIQTPSSGGGLD